MTKRSIFGASRRVGWRSSERVCTLRVSSLADHRPRERCDPATTPVASGSAPREKNDFRPEKWY
ncbi:MAG: hypothetical protein F6K24_20570 [Okeania sp. SIO2D1]|nr:hypothetical protein [Okeania sp. SIO2D1]